MVNCGVDRAKWSGLPPIKVVESTQSGSWTRWLWGDSAYRSCPMVQHLQVLIIGSRVEVLGELVLDQSIYGEVPAQSVRCA